MDAWVDGDLAGEFERQLDDLLAELNSDWVEPELPPRFASDESFRRYHRRNGKRWRLACVLRERPDLAATLADRVLAAVVCDEDVAANRQLIEPMSTAVGRRRVQEYLISVVTSGPLPQGVCAVRAWYWSQAVLIYESTEALHSRQPTTVSQTQDDEVADLRASYRAACLTAFVECDHDTTREWLSRGFILDESFYPSNLHRRLAQARAIAEADPVRFKELIARTTDGTNLAAIRRRDDR
ncbi:hypothetical protein ACIA3K_30330 [Micromonospora sp. NPDC051543]|uniref:hypothetical protein n=1 Tax=Micromonospora sp. NPDC051543 TaxID=3364287 RepID=UPI0037B2776C